MHRKLPVMEVFKEALSIIWENRAFILAISWPYLLVQLLILVPAAALLPEASLKLKAMILTQGLLLCIMGVYWHRKILLQESTLPAVPLRFDRFVWCYMGYLVILALISMAIITANSLLVVGMITGGAGHSAIVGLMAVPLAFVMLIVLGRFSLALPAAAIGDRETGVRRSWQLTRNNSWRVGALYLLTMAVVLVVALPIGLVSDGIADIREVLWLQLIANAVLNWGGAVLGLTALSLAYDWFRHKAPPVDADMSD